jgi:hypothetical protein
LNNTDILGYLRVMVIDQSCLGLLPHASPALPQNHP